MSAPDEDAVQLARAQLEAVVEDIRAVDGNAELVAEPGFADVVAAARHRPIVYLAAAESGGLALVVRDGAVSELDLPGLRAGALREKVDELGRWRAAFDRADAESADAAWRRWSAELDQVTGWLWDVAMGPLIDDVRPAGESFALVPCGLLGVLPLHAAWTPDEGLPAGRRYAADLAVWTYTANARALSACFAAATDVDMVGSVVVADPEATGPMRLPAMRTLGDVVKATFPAGPAPLFGADATPEAFRCLPPAELVFLGCHGKADPAAPLRSRIELTGGMVTLDEVLRLRLPARLAIAAACDTAAVGLDLPDEVVSLATGLVQAGAAAVIASMWECDELATAVVLVEFFRLSAERPPAVALRDAQRLVRDSTLRELRQRWEKALDEGAAWLPERAGDALLNRLLEVHDERPWSGVEVWAALSYTGA
ncbi:CHAT domain-containing protein [Actinoplanes sp. NPDC051411]|uniref:CHAT domain-containing protein n=1 Tax=Actinoplanes sp. NPDC051411 TaxID=3155522 RepID=UPI0034442CC5